MLEKVIYETNIFTSESGGLGFIKTKRRLETLNFTPSPINEEVKYNNHEEKIISFNCLFINNDNLKINKVIKNFENKTKELKFDSDYKYEDSQFFPIEEINLINSHLNENIKENLQIERYPILKDKNSYNIHYCSTETNKELNDLKKSQSNLFLNLNLLFTKE
jgi:hypothetical protein